jgi:hypothetical protein
MQRWSLGRLGILILTHEKCQFQTLMLAVEPHLLAEDYAAASQAIRDGYDCLSSYTH